MKINSYAIGMDSARTSSSYKTGKLSLTMSKQSQEESNSLESFGNSMFKSLFSNEEDDNTLINSTNSDNQSSSLDAFNVMKSNLSNGITSQPESTRTVTSLKELHNTIVQYLWQMLFRDRHSCKPDSYYNWADTTPSYGTQLSASYPMTITFEQEYYHEETQSVSFSATGSVTTEDGRAIDFNLDFNMSQSFTEYYKEQVSVAQMIDPLVINFSGDISTLSDTTFTFDLDNDGNEDNISVLSRGSGFLALDKNNDGIINDGSELFGTQSGNGFADLAAYDSDGNGWIDENDDIWNSLKIWVKDETGEDELYSLKDKNVGAIFLGNVNTDYTLRSESTGSVNGALRRSGVFLYEDGSGAGLISHLDIAN